MNGLPKKMIENEKEKIKKMRITYCMSSISFNSHSYGHLIN